MIQKQMKPATLERLEDAIFPSYWTPKFDGIRCGIQDRKALSYQLKPIPNHHVRGLLEQLPDGPDGELVSDTFNNTQSTIMTHDGKPKFVFHVFDVIPQDNCDPGYIGRFTSLKVLIYHNKKKWPFIKFVQPTLIRNITELHKYEEKMVNAGYEGIIGRTNSPYKFGRSTLKQFWMVKYKRFVDAEGILVGIKERISIKGTPMGTTGSLILKTKWGHLPVGGFTAKQAQELWDRFDYYKGSKVTFKYQKAGMKDMPRFGTFKGIRRD